MNKIIFDFFQGDVAPSNDFVQWIPRCWYFSNGLPIKEGFFSNGDRWVFFGWFLGKEEPTVVIKRFIKNGDIETLFDADGQFILIIYYKARDCIEIYRDRTGILPFALGKGEKGIAGSIWIENVRKLAGIENRASIEVLTELPVYRIAIPPASIIESVKSLSGKCSVNIAGDKITSNEHPMIKPSISGYNSIQAASDHLGQILSESVKRRIRGLKSVGVWLSGGNDSSLLVALVRKHFGGNICTIFVTFEDYDRDYGKYAKEVSNNFETNHSEVVVGAKDYLNLWAETISIIQEPVNSPCTIGQLAALKQVSPAVEALLIGEGADTIFGGPYWAPFLFMSYIGGGLPRFFRRYLQHLYTNIHKSGFLFTAISKSLKALGTPIREYVHSEILFGSEEEIDNVFGNGIWRRSFENFEPFIKDDLLNDFVLFLLLDWLTIWNGALKRLGFYTDIPYVFPFLDYELMKNSMRLPVHLRYHYTTKKAALKKYAENFFSKEFIYKPKEGFGVPFAKWFSRKEYSPFLNLPLEGRSLKRSWWNESEIRRIIDLHKSGHGTDKSAESVPWIATNIELWARISLEGDSPDLYKI